MPSNEFLPTPATPDDICSLFNDAYYAARVDEDGDVVVETDLIVVLRFFGRMLQMYAPFGLSGPLDRAEIIESVNNMNASRAIPRAAFVQDDDGDGTLIYDWSVPLLAPVRKKDLVEAFRMFLAAAADAMQDSPIVSADG